MYYHQISASRIFSKMRFMFNPKYYSRDSSNYTDISTAIIVDGSWNYNVKNNMHTRSHQSSK